MTTNTNGKNYNNKIWQIKVMPERLDKCERYKQELLKEYRVVIDKECVYDNTAQVSGDYTPEVVFVVEEGTVKASPKGGQWTYQGFSDFLDAWAEDE